MGDLVETINQGDTTSEVLFQSAYRSWLLGTTNSLIGATSIVPTILRHALESAIYAFLFERDEQWERFWWDRQHDPKAKQKLRRPGPMAEAMALLKHEDENLHQLIRGRLDHLIDFGAHPNVLHLALGVEAISSQTMSEDASTMILSGEEQTQRSIIMVNSCGNDLLSVFGLIWPERFSDKDGLGRTREVHEMCQRDYSIFKSKYFG